LKIAYFDCAFGAAGDMLLGACLDAGLSLSILESKLSLLGLSSDQYALSVQKVHRCSILASHLNVMLKGAEHKSVDKHDHDGHSHKSHGHDHDHDHKHKHDHDDDKHLHSHPPDHGHKHDDDNSHHHRSLSSITKLIESSKLASPVKDLALRIFHRLGVAESKVHGVPLDEIHFHEVGAIDAIVDIVGFAIAYVELGIEQAYVSALPIGSGTVKTMHGLFPVPGPATLNLLAEVGAPTRDLNVSFECLTPTGAAILTTCAHAFGAAPAFERIDHVGYGAGTLDAKDHPNVVRLILGDSRHQQNRKVQSFSSIPQLAQTDSCDAQIVAVIECNLDDCSPQIMAYTAEQLLTYGALDVTITPCLMKKGRPGYKLSVVAEPESRDSLSQIIIKETTTLGVRSYMCERLTLTREFREVKIGEHTIRVKIARDTTGKILNMHPEYDDCTRVAHKSGLALKEVILDSLKLAQTITDSL
jgi:uncharacterized protein (TIGR00299 family) protein